LKLNLPFLGELPLNLEVRMAGDAGTPIAATDSPLGEPYARLARRLIDGGMG
jgi:ATP-binding protein involved in chromosome partitioning